jgi:hypothetical protein
MMRRRRGRHDLEATALVRDARDLPGIAEDSGTVVVRPQHLQDLVYPGGVTRYN